MEKKWDHKRSVIDYFKKTISIYFLTIFLFLGIFFFLNSNIPQKIKELASRVINFKLDNSSLNFLKNNDLKEKTNEIKEKYNTFTQKLDDFKKSIITKTQNFSNELESLKENFFDKINKISQKNIEIPESFYFYSKNPTKIYIYDENITNILVNWGDDSEENIKIEKEKIITHFWEKEGRYKIKIKFLKDKKLLKEVVLNILVE